MKQALSVVNEGGNRKIAIVDDHAFMRRGLEQFIGSLDGFEFAWAASNAAEALYQLSKSVPDVMIVDISLPDRSGLELIKDAHGFYPGLRMLVLSMHEDDLYSHRAIKAGAKGYLMKSDDYDVFERALRRVSAGKLWLSEEVSDKILNAFTRGTTIRAGNELDTLTDREFEVFQHLGEGRNTSQVAGAMGISSKTVDVHRASIRAKLNLKGGGDVMRFAIRWGESRRLSIPSGKTD